MHGYTYVICRLHGLFTAIHSSTVQTIQQVGAKHGFMESGDLSFTHMYSRRRTVPQNTIEVSITPSQRYVSVHS